MSQQLGATSTRPRVSRTRSHTDPSKPNPSPTEPQTAGPTLPPARPPHVRSQSYLSPAEIKPRNAHTLPAPSALERTAERLHRVHIPGSSHLHHHRHSRSHSHSRASHSTEPSSSHIKRHRPTQSEALQRTSSFRKPQSKPSKENLPHLVAGLNAEREKRTHLHHANTNTSLHPPSGGNAVTANSNPSSTTNVNGAHVGMHAFGPSTSQTSDYTDGGRYDPRPRAVTDPRRVDGAAAIAPQLRPKSSFEQALERGDQARIARRIHVKKEDIIRRDAEIAAAEDEMRSRIATITAKGVEITRRLDYGYYNLLETLGSLVATITSFQSLGKQTGQLITNFDKESERLDSDTRRRVHGFKRDFDRRRAKADEMQERGTKVNDRAEDLSRRLENARQIVENWERREDKVRRTWGRVWRMVWWVSVVVVVVVVGVVLGKEWWFRGDPVRAGLRGHAEGSWNKTLRLGGGEGSTARQNEQEVLEGVARVPEDVRQLLVSIADRNRERKVMFPEVPVEMKEGSGSRARAGDGLGSGQGEDPRMRVLDEL
ncbi:hypothetical protein LTR67_002979 [Exophiala xenobiotica]